MGSIASSLRLLQAALVLAGPALLVMAAIYIPAAFLIRYDLFFTYKVFMLVWSFLLLVYFTNKYLLWLLRCYILTDQRVVVVEYGSLFSKAVTEAPLKTIANVKYHTHGFQALLDLGDVETKISGLNEPLVLKNQRHPDKIKDLLWQLHEKSLQAEHLDREKGVFEQNPVQVRAKFRKIV